MRTVRTVRLIFVEQELENVTGDPQAVAAWQEDPGNFISWLKDNGFVTHSMPTFGLTDLGRNRETITYTKEEND